MWFEIILVLILFKFKKNVSTFLEIGLYSCIVNISPTSSAISNERIMSALTWAMHYGIA